MEQNKAQVYRKGKTLRHLSFWVWWAAFLFCIVVTTPPSYVMYIVGGVALAALVFLFVYCLKFYKNRDRKMRNLYIVYYIFVFASMAVALYSISANTSWVRIIALILSFPASLVLMSIDDTLKERHKASGDSIEEMEKD